MGQSLNLTIRLRNDASANWTKANPILQAGEPGVEIDTLKFKIGNGTTSWNQLPYISGGSDIIASSGGILIVDTLPEIGDESIFYKINSSQKLYYWNNTTSKILFIFKY